MDNESIFLRKLNKFDKNEIIELICTIAIVLFINTFIFGITVVSGESMNPTLQNKDRILLKKYESTLGIDEYNYGDIVVFKSPLENDNRLFIKRVIGIPGDKIEIIEDKLYINNKYIEENYIDTESYTESLVYGESYLVPQNEIFVIGDNRFPGASNDSRSFGSITFNRIEGKAIFRIFPLNKIGKEFK